MFIPNNPAARLSNFIDRARQAEPPSRETLETWMQIFGEKDKPEFLRKFSKLVGLIPATINAVRSQVSKTEADRLLAWKDQILKGLDPVLFASTWEHAATRLKDPTAYALLGICAVRLSELSPEPVIEDETIAAFHQEVSDLRGDLDNLPEDLADAIAEYLAAISQALQDYPLCGVDAVGDSVRGIIGDLVLRWRQGRPTNVPARFWTFLGRLADAAQVASLLLQAPTVTPPQLPELCDVVIVDESLPNIPTLGPDPDIADIDLKPVASHGGDHAGR